MTSLGTTFKGNTAITSFNELEKFTGVTALGERDDSTGYGTFADCSSLKELTLPKNCEVIKVEALAKCTALEKVNGFEKIKTIRNRACYDSLLSQDLRLDNVEGTIPYMAFSNTSIKSVHIGDKVTSLANVDNSSQGAFANCKQLCSVRIPTSLNIIGGNAFYGCTALKEITGDMSGVTAINYRAFDGCTSLEIADLSIPNLEKISESAFNGVKITKISNLGKLTSLPNISTPIFGDKTTLTSVNLPSTLTSIGENVFNGYSALANVNFPSTITRIGNNAFKNCTALAIIIDLPNLETLGQNSFNINISTPGSIIGIENLGKITTIPNSDGCFRNQTNLTYAKLPDTLTTIGNRAFFACTSLTNINFPSAITTIGESAFNGCASLEIEDLLLPNLTSLGLNAFYGVKIKKISNLGSITTLPGILSTNGTLGDKSTLEEVVLPETLTSIGAGSINGYANLTSIGSGVFPNLTTINYNCFYNIPNVAQVVSFPALTSVASNSGNERHDTLSKCGFTEFHAPLLDLANTDVYRQGHGLFLGCTNLRVLEIGKLTAVPFSFASGCTSLENVLDLSNVTLVRNSAFRNTPSLRIHLKLPVCTKVLADTANGNDATFYNSGILSLDAPMLMEIGKGIYSSNSRGAFQECANLTLVKLRDVTTIGMNAFYKCPNLSKVIIDNETPPTRSNGAFASCSSDLAFYVPDSAVEAYKTATNWSTYADRIKPLSEYVES